MTTSVSKASAPAKLQTKPQLAIPALTTYYSQTTRAFYSRQAGDKTLPADAVTVPAATFTTLMAAQAAGHFIQPDPKTGAPVAVAPPAASPIAGFQKALRAAFNAQAVSWGFDSFAEAATFVTSTVTLMADEAKALLAWRDASQVSSNALLAAIKAGTSPAPATPAAFVTAVLAPTPTRPTA
jgi:hypothetical protein